MFAVYTAKCEVSGDFGSVRGYTEHFCSEVRNDGNCKIIEQTTTVYPQYA